MMSAKSRQRLMRIWMGLSVLFFAASGAERLKPYLKAIFGEKGAAQSPAQPAPEAQAFITGLRVASWNLQFLDVGARGSERRQAADYEALRRYVTALNADVIAVQEVASPIALSQLFSSSDYDFYLARRGGSQRSGFVYRKGLPIKQYPDLDALALADLRAGADVGITVNGQELRLLSVHLKAFCVTGPLDAKDRDCEKLHAQLPALEGWVDARAKEQVPFAVLGDFNRMLEAQGDELLRELDDDDPRGLTLRRAPFAGGAPCRPHRRQAQIDHLLLGGPATRWLAGSGVELLPYAAADLEAGRKLSDHCPIRATLTPVGAH